MSGIMSTHFYDENKHDYNMIHGLNKKINKNEMYILHSTSIKNLLDILTDCDIYANKYITKDKRRLSGNIESKYIYASIILNGQKILNFGAGLIINDKLLFRRLFIFNKAWIATKNKNSMIVKSNDSDVNKKAIFKKIKEYLSTTDTLTGHEILFKNKIKNIKKYLLGVYCPNCDESEIAKIKKIIDDGGYKIKIYTGAYVPII